ncbi:hexitol phosphatase HxpB [Motiliproteus sediminis]|uniref:hexitol phosphatase HxpB n=1 Tax=Motiliproteus sediminis TaxID=1468178 RepID=UPI001AEF8BF0|nr:hexitol phosphatase HxpB [Motiliproteus sediminis]
MGLQISADAIVFDLDGVLINSEPLWRQAEIELFASTGLWLSDSDCALTQGLRIDEVVDYWCRRKPGLRCDRTALAAAIIERAIELIQQQGAALPTAVETVHNLKQQYPLAIASSSSLRLIDAALQRLRLTDCFRQRLSAEQELRGKPHPAVYLAAAKALGIAPERCVAIEDSVNGMLAAQRAGMSVVVIPAKEQRQRPEWAEADRCLESLAELPAALAPVTG